MAAKKKTKTAKKVPQKLKKGKAAPKKVKPAAKKPALKKVKAVAKKAAPKKVKPAAKKAAPKKAAKPAAAPPPPAPVSPGKFVWHELATGDSAKAVAFYTSLFGWTSSDMDMGPAGTYTLFTNGTTQVAGIQPIAAGDPTPAHWQAYCTVTDVDAATSLAQSKGGTVLVPPMDIPTIGRFSVVADPQGAVLLPFKPLGPEGPVGPVPPGGFCWDELLSSDPEAATKFYPEIYGWNVAPPRDMGAMGNYWVLLSGENMRGGIMGLPMPGVPPHWATHVAVANLEESVAKAESLGASVIAPPMDVPGFGRFSTIRDTVGATINLFQGNSQ